MEYRPSGVKERLNLQTLTRLTLTLAILVSMSLPGSARAKHVPAPQGLAGHRAAPAGVSRAQALQRAQRKQLATGEFSHPYFWSAFLLVSNWL